MLLTKDAREAAAVFAGTPGAVIAYPTETYYGLGSLIADGAGIGRIVAVKGREASKGMIVLVSSMEEALALAVIDTRQQGLLGLFWPGPLSALLEARPGMHPLLAPGGRVALRISPHPLALALVREAGPVTSTSANPSGLPPATGAAEVVSFGLALDAVLDGGETPGGLPSTLVDLTVWPPACLREGVVPARAVMEKAAGL